MKNPGNMMSSIDFKFNSAKSYGYMMFSSEIAICISLKNTICFFFELSLSHLQPIHQSSLDINWVHFHQDLLIDLNELID